MAEMQEHNEQTPKKRPTKPFRGAIDGRPFTSENQPTPEQKKKGWDEVRKQRLLTQSVLRHLLGSNLEDGAKLDDYAAALIKLAKDGNAKAIESVNKVLEDDVQKIHLSGGLENTLTYDLSKVKTDTLKELLNAATTDKSS